MNSTYHGHVEPVDRSNFREFKDVLAKYSQRVALVDERGGFVRYEDILELSCTPAFEATKGRIVLCQLKNDPSGLAGYLAFMAADAVPMMVSSKLNTQSLELIVEAYSPEYIWSLKKGYDFSACAEETAAFGTYSLVRTSVENNDLALDSDLGALLSTSGSTGAGKYVRLSRNNLWSNAEAIACYLNLGQDEVAITSLPPSYSFGLSVIHSHVWVGATIAVTNKTFFDRDFWTFFRSARATSLAGVPYHFEILKKLGFMKMKLPHLATLTQAGGKMSLDLTQEYAAYCNSNGARFFTMYGQTEAAPRISYVPAEQAIAKAGTIGIPVPNGQLELQSESGDVLTGSHIVGELVYRGPNVCLGYAESRADLSLGDINQGTLYTGDLAERDDDGYYRIVGRKKRFIKLFGNRIHLDDVESMLSRETAEVACTGSDDLLEIYLGPTSSVQAIEIKKSIMNILGVGAQGIAVYEIDAMPRNESGKLRYADLISDKARRLA